jgi:hypothetical protein
MAIITIPSSIGGVSIPGITNVPGGPLGVLFGSGKKLTSLQYPRDLGSQTKGHVVQFTINEIKPTQFSETNAGKALNNLRNENYAEAGTNAKNAIQDTATEIKSIFGKAADAYGGGDTFQIALNKRQKSTKASISLYMPETVDFQYSADYGTVSLVDTITKTVDKIPGISTGDILKSDISKLALASQGLAVNDQNQILFERIDFRNFSFSFTFTPYSREETNQIKDIIKAFRSAAAPTIQKGGSGLMFVVPNTIDIAFRFNGDKNEYITKTTECVIQNIDVNYAPNGWSAHADGSPTQIQLTMTFKELLLVDKQMIEQGY